MTSKTLILFRHGKSDWDAPSGRDFDRPLAERGIRDARRMGKFLRTAGQIPDLVLSSSALRAQTTAQIAADAGQWQCPLQLTEELYNASSGTLLNEIHRLPENASCVLLAGHEPTFSEVVRLLTGGGQVKMSAAAMASIKLPIVHWSEAHADGAMLNWLMQVKLLG